MSEFLDSAIDAAQEAGDFLLEHFGNIRTIERKPDNSLVTNLDKEAEKIIVDKLRGTHPDISIFAEETGRIEGSAVGTTWIIDPLDGTHNFIRGISMFGVSIGLIKDSQFVAGCIYLPIEHAMYAAELGAGAFKNKNRMHVSTCSSIEEISLLFDSGFHTNSTQRMKAFQLLAPRVFNIRMLGASSRNMTYLAEGKADLLLEFDERLWDFAAGVVIIREAGGVVTGFDGGPLTPDSSQFIASNKALHGRILELFNKNALVK